MLLVDRKPVACLAHEQRALPESSFICCAQQDMHGPSSSE